MISVLMISASSSYGGGPQHLYDLSKGIRGSAIVNIACPHQEPFWSRFNEVIDGNVIKIPERKVSFAAIFRLLVFIRREKIVLLHSHGKGAGVYGRILSILTGVPLVHTLHGIHLDQYSLFMKCVYLCYEYFFGWIDACDIFVSQSEFFRASRLCIAKNSRSRIICNGVESQEPCAKNVVPRFNIRSALDVPDGVLLVVTLSRFDYAKNMDEMLNLAVLAKDIKFLLLGDGENYDRIKSRVSDCNLNNVILTGFVNNPLDYLAAADVYISTSRWEGLPLSVLQAMSLGKPVIASNVTGNCDAVLHAETGYLYTLGDHCDALKYLKMLSDDFNLRESMGRAGAERQRSEFGMARMVKKTMDVYLETLSARMLWRS